MIRPKLLGKKRQVLGRKLKKLRNEGVLPANVYGKKVRSVAVQLDLKEFAKIYQDVGETGIVDLAIEGEKETRPVLIHNVQKGPVTDKLLHADFRQVILTEKVAATIPVELIGEAPAEIQKLGILVQQVSEIEVEALPADLPEHFQVEVAKLANVGDQILVKDLQFDKKKVELKVSENQIVAKVEPLAKEEVVAPPPVEEVVPAEAVPGEEKPVEEAGKPAEAVKPKKEEEPVNLPKASQS